MYLKDNENPELRFKFSLWLSSQVFHSFLPTEKARGTLSVHNRVIVSQAMKKLGTKNAQEKEICTLHTQGAH